ncbi:MAG: NAD(P)-binding domain-containing protein, partial [Pseudomonadota bacterium]|nr:NAD(P)-binding domain-containing protein [Pseudomonadota bacterium]
MTIGLDGRLVLIGAGKMGGAMLDGWLNEGLAAASLVAIDPAPTSEVRALAGTRGLLLNPDVSGLGDAQVVVLAVKPQIFEAAMSGLGALKQAKSLVISIVAGKTIAALERHFGRDAAVIRAMPNTPAAVGRGITAFVANRNVNKSQLALAIGLLSAVGEVVTVASEEQIDTVTAVSGSGPAYV